jgi:hypothetical protein
MKKHIDIQKLFKKWFSEKTNSKELLNTRSSFYNGAWKMKLFVVKYIPSKDGTLSAFMKRKKYIWYCDNLKHIKDDSLLVIVGR